MSSALGINAHHHHGTKPSGASRSHVIIASAGEPNVKVIVHRKQFKLSLFTHSLAVVVLLFHLTLFHIIVITSIKPKKRQKQYDKTCSRYELSLYGKELHEDSQNFAKEKVYQFGMT